MNKEVHLLRPMFDEDWPKRIQCSVVCPTCGLRWETFLQEHWSYGSDAEIIEGQTQECWLCHSLLAYTRGRWYKVG